MRRANRRASADPLERHFLQFDGAADFAYAPGALADLGDTYTVAIKVAAVLAAGANHHTWFSVYDETPVALNQGHNRILYCTNNGNGGLYANGFTAAGSLNWQGTNPSSSELGVPKVIAATRSPGAIKFRLIKASGLEASHTYAPSIDRAALHVALGAALQEDHSIAVPTQMGNGRYTGALVAARDIPDTELAAWAARGDARACVPDLTDYWPVSSLSGAVIPSYGTRGTPMALVSLGASQLVRLTA